MKSIRLNDTKRMDILQSVISAWEKENEEPKIHILENKCANDYYIKSLGENLCKKLRDPSIRDYINTRSYVPVQVCGEIFHFNLLNNLPAKCDRNIIGIFDKKSKFHIEYEKAKDKHDLWLEEKRLLSRETSQILDAVSTTKQLLEVWPQIKPLIPAYIFDPSDAINLPMIPISRLNERLGLK